ncbi:DUF4136 domain-containing protein [Pseudokordiimonas caeni]|uniref:DUF4136 domain-containing protein n=1 Tax=Pseudokordiimonas caeni TaxID=2997908 RepID=UPI002810AF9E|nr:DUF4136 domain-containing protein [Pseudokordiimonas caeni]
MSNQMIIQRFMHGAAIAGLLGLAACSGRDTTSEVTRMHDPALPETGKVAIRPTVMISESDDGFTEFARLIATELREEGYSVVDDPSDADLIAFVDYEVSTEYRNWRQHWSPPYSGYWFRRGVYSPYIYPWEESFYNFGPSTRVYVTDDIKYARSLELDIVKPLAGPDRTVFEGHAVSLGRNADLSEVMPYLVAAMFSDFPGEGGTKVISIEDDGIAKPSSIENY